MSISPPVRPVRAALATGVGLLLACTLTTPVHADVAERRNTNPTGTRSGSAPNGAGNLGVSLSATPDGRIKVTWERSKRVSRFKRIAVQVSPSRKMQSRVKAYRVKGKDRRRHRLVVKHAFNATPASGNYSFVKVVGVLRGGGRTASPAKWIQAPVTSRCTASAANRATVATFNVRTWTADRGTRHSWSARGPRAVAEIRRSGAGAVAIQEASGDTGVGFGNKRQHRWILDRLNASDRGARWADALPDDAYRPPKGRKPGLVGTRVFYDAARYRLLDSGLIRLAVPGYAKDSLLPWARLQAIGRRQAPFVLASTHLRVGAEGSRAGFQTRSRQVAGAIAGLRSLRSRFGNQVVLGADLNSTANTRPYNNVQRALLRAGFYDAYASSSIANAKFPTTHEFRFPISKTPLRRDYLMTLGMQGSCGYRNQIYKRASQIASDHFLQAASLPLPAA